MLTGRFAQVHSAATLRSRRPRPRYRCHGQVSRKMCTRTTASLHLRILPILRASSALRNGTSDIATDLALAREGLQVQGVTMLTCMAFMLSGAWRCYGAAEGPISSRGCVALSDCMILGRTGKYPLASCKVRSSRVSIQSSADSTAQPGIRLLLISAVSEHVSSRAS